jgi:hypothetical protein
VAKARILAMGNSLNDLFAEQKSRVIEWGGASLWGAFELPVDRPGLVIRFLGSDSSYAQGVELDVKGGLIESGGLEGRAFRFWQDHRPVHEVVLRWLPRAARSLLVWNLWAWPHQGGDIVHAFWGNAGMRVEVVGDGLYRFRCSDGQGDVDFSNLVFDVEMARPDEASKPWAGPKRPRRGSAAGG